MVSIGLPEILMIMKHPKLWDTFFRELGLDVVKSGKTTKKIMELGITNAEDETCIPVKAYQGHVLSLKNKCDKIFIPRYQSLFKGCFGCPKFFAICDIAKIILDAELEDIK